MSISELEADRGKRNKELIASLREDPNHAQLLAACKEEIKVGRMRDLRLAHEINLEAVTLSPRFGVEQGEPQLHVARVRCTVMLHSACRYQGGRQQESPAL